MPEKQKVQDMTEQTIAAYFDLEFCNERISRHNIPVSIGVTYRQGDKEIGSYYTLIWCGDEMELWKEQLEAIGYNREQLKATGKSMEAVTEDLLSLHALYHPQYYISFGKQDEQLLKKHVTEKLSGFHFADAMQYLPKRLGMKYDISLEKYAYICGLNFIHTFEPLEDARILADIFWCVLCGREDENRRQEVFAEYGRKMFLIEYHNKKQAYDYLNELPVRSLRQEEKRKMHAAYLKKHQKRYEDYMAENGEIASSKKKIP